MIVIIFKQLWEGFHFVYTFSDWPEHPHLEEVGKSLQYVMTLSCLCSGAKCKTYSSYSAPTSCLDIRTRSIRTGELFFLLSISLSLPSIPTEAGEYARLSVFSYEVSEKSLFFLSPVPSQRLSFLLYVMLLGLRFGSLLHAILLAALWQSAVRPYVFLYGQISMF